MNPRTTLTIGGLVVLLTMGSIVLAAGGPDRQVFLLEHALMVDPAGTSLSPSQTPPPTLPGSTPTPTSTPSDWIYAPAIFDIASTATATIPPDATPTIWLTQTPPPIGPYAEYVSLILDTASTPTLMPTPTVTIPPDATPTIWLTHTPPPF